MKTTARLLGCAMFGLVVLALGSVPAAARADDDGFRPLFDGKSLDGWDGNSKHWRVEGGVIVGETTKDNPTPHNTFLIWRGGQPGDFELKVEYKLHSGNTGIQFRSWEGPSKWRVGGYQTDMDAGNTFTGILYGEQYRGILCNRGEKVVFGKDHKKKAERFADGKELASAIKQNDWNEYRIVAQGSHMYHELNGRKMIDVTDEDTVARKDGIIALQLHAGPPMKVEFRNIRLKETKPAATAKKKIVLIAGTPSHGYGSHEHNAGCELLAKCINENVPGAEAVVYRNGWPKDPKALDGAASVVIFADGGGGGHPAMGHLDVLDRLAKQGVGIACLHYAVEIPKGKEGDLLKSWIGGYYETFWSVNPHWKGTFKQFPKHPVANGLKPFTMDDEWYYNMRFVDDMKGVTPILTTVPPDSTRRPGNDAHGANPFVFANKGRAEHVAWAYERPGGGRGFGFTGGHWHWSWASDSFRKVVLNGIVWTAGLEVPADGVASKTPTFEELEVNQDEPQPGNLDKQKIRGWIEEWKKEAEGK